MTQIKVKQCHYGLLDPDLRIDQKCAECNQLFGFESHIIIPQVNIWCRNDIVMPAYMFMYHRHCFHRALKLIAHLERDKVFEEEEKAYDNEEHF